MSVYTYILISAIIFILIIFVLVAMLLGVKAKLLPSGPVKILINDENYTLSGKDYENGKVKISYGKKKHGLLILS